MAAVYCSPVRKFILPAMVLLSLLSGCSSGRETGHSPKAESEPDPRFFPYYDPRFREELPRSPLRTDGLYFRIAYADSFGDNHHILRFYPDGLVIVYQVYTPPDKVVQFDRISKGNIHGYYGITGDSLFFSTKVYYDQRDVFYSGKIQGDSIKIYGDSPEEEAPSPRTYYFFAEN
jgi:hypothetical protein